MEKTLGIDLGTEAARLAHLVDGEAVLIVNENRQPDHPAFIGFGKKGDILIGESARNRYLLHPESVAHSFLQLAGRSMDDAVFRVYSDRLYTPVQLDAKGNCQIHIGERDFTPLDLLALFFYTLKNRAEKITGEVYSRAVIALPDHFGERQIVAVRLAASKAGLTPLQIVHQTSAAGLEYAYTSLDSSERLVLVYSLGRVFDTAVMKMRPGMIEVLGSEGDSLIGGDFFTDQLTDHLYSEIEQKTGQQFSDNTEALLQILRLADTVKTALSGQLSYEIDLTALGKQEVNFQTEVTREEFEELIQPSLLASFRMTEKALAQAGIRCEQINTVLMVGSSCQIPVVERELRQRFPNAQVLRPINQKGVVALGAAVYTGLISTITCEKCQHSNEIQQVICGQCGADLREPAKVLCPACLSVENSGQDVCAKCGYVFSRPEGETEGTVRPAGLPKKEMEQAACTVAMEAPAGGSILHLEVGPEQSIALPGAEGEHVTLPALDWRDGVFRGPVYIYSGDVRKEFAGTLVMVLGEARASTDRLEVVAERSSSQELRFVIRPARSAQAQYWQGQRGRWELNRYRREHNLTMPGTADTAASARPPCTETGCAEEAGETCCWCGRHYCGQHLMITDAGQQVCAACLEPVLRQMAASAVRTGNVDLIERFLTSLRPGQKNHPLISLYLGLVKAQHGAYQEAVPILEGTALASGLDRRLVGQARLGRAKMRLEARDMQGVMQDLAAALTDDPSLQVGSHHLDLVELQIYQLVESGQLAQAIRELEKRREANPLDVKLIHRLAILYYRLISLYEQEMIRSLRGESASLHELPIDSIERCWHRLIAFWGAVLFSESYWQQWLQERCAVSGLSVDQEVVEAVRDNFEERILQDVRNWIMEYRDAGQNKQADRLGGNDLLWEFELETARLLGEISREYRIPGWPAGFSCGTTMMLFLHATAAGRPVVDGLLAAKSSLGGESGLKLQRYLTPMGRYHFLLEHNHYERVLVELAPVARLPEDRIVLGTAYCQRGVERITMDGVEDGITDFEQAQKCGVDLTPYAARIAEAAVKRTLQRLNDEGDPAYDGMIDLLERVRALIGNEPQVRSNLVASLGQRARIANNAHNYPEAEKYLLRALAIDPNDKTIRHFAAVTYGNIANELMNRNQPERALEYLKKSVSYENTPENRHHLCIALHNYGVDLANADRHTDAIRYLLEALQMENDPTTRRIIAQVYVSRGISRYKNGDRYGGRQDVEEALRYDPYNNDIRNIYHQM